MEKYFNLALKGLILLILIISVFYLPKAIMLYSGYCFEQKRYISTQEKLDIAVSDIIIKLRSRVTRADYSLNEAGEVASERFILSYQYTDLKEFYAMNPNCCFLVNARNYHAMLGHAVPLRKRLKGSLNPLFLSIRYIAAFDEQNNNVPIYKKTYYGFSNCGKLYINPYFKSVFGDWGQD